MIEVDQLSKHYGDVTAVDGVSFSAESGQILGFLGPNGAGKTTTLNALSGILALREGSIQIGDLNIAEYMPHQLIPKGVVHVPEGRRIFARLSVDENLAMGAFSRSDDKSELAKDREYVLEMFPRLRERLTQTAGTLSGGEQQMLAIGRALMSKPDVLLLDEPSMGLAPVLVEQVFESIIDINKAGVTCMLVEQNAYMALQIASYGYVLEGGRIALEGEAGVLAKNEEIKKAYLG